jgi:hypothetical protein
MKFGMKDVRPILAIAVSGLLLAAGIVWLRSERKVSRQAAPDGTPAAKSTVTTTGNVNRDPVTQPPPPAISKQMLPERVQRLMSNPDKFPSWATLQQLQPDDLPILKSLYREETSLTNRMSLMFALAVHGDDEVVEMFQYSLNQEFNGKTLNAEEAKVLKTMVIGLGVLAGRSDKALEILHGGLDYGYWRFRRTWQAEREYDGYPDYGFVNRTIQALALAGRTEFPEIIAKVTKRDADYLARMDGAIITALAFHELARTKGREAVISSYVTDGGSEALRAWRQSSMSSSWDKWQAGIYYSKHEGAPLPVPPKVEPILQARP